jgi:hypothetical protein
LHHREASVQLRPLVFDERNDGLGAFAASPGREAQQDNSSGNPLVGENDASKILVLGQEQPTCSHREVNDFRILGARRDFGDSDDVVTGAA